MCSSDLERKTRRQTHKFVLQDMDPVRLPAALDLPGVSLIAHSSAKPSSRQCNIVRVDFVVLM